jgi:hypothetical protein
MNSVILIPLMILGANDASPSGPRVLSLQEGRVVQVWPSQPAPEMIRPQADRPGARPFGAHPDDGITSRVAANPRGRGTTLDMVRRGSIAENMASRQGNDVRSDRTGGPDDSRNAAPAQLPTYRKSNRAESSTREI